MKASTKAEVLQQQQQPEQIVNLGLMYSPAEVLRARQKNTPIRDKAKPGIQRVIFRQEAYPVNYCFFTKFHRSSRLKDKQVVGYIEPTSSADQSAVLVWDAEREIVHQQFEPVLGGKEYPRSFQFKTHWLIENKIPKNTVVGHIRGIADYIPAALLVWMGGSLKQYDHYFFYGYKLNLNQLIFPKYHNARKLNEGAHIGIEIPVDGGNPRILQWKNGAIVSTETNNRTLQRSLSAFEQFELVENYPNGLPLNTSKSLQVGEQKYRTRERTKKGRRGKTR